MGPTPAPFRQAVRPQPHFLLSFNLPPPTREESIRSMERIEKTVFISYRRTNIPWALAIFQNLTHHGYDVFFDYNGIASGDFERVILGNIKARALSLSY
jgi:TIR domain